MTYETFKVDIKNNVAHIAINRPTKANSMNQQAWDDLKAIFEEADRNTDCLLYTSPSPRDATLSRMPSSA